MPNTKKIERWKQTEKTITCAEAAKLLRVARSSIPKWLETGKLQGERATCNNKKGWYWRVYKSSVLKLGAELTEKREDKAEKKAKRVEPGTALEPEVEVDIGPIKDAKISRSEAERRLKIEQYKRLERERFIAEKDLVSLATLEEDLEKFAGGIYPAIAEEVDLFFVEHGQQFISGALSVALQKRLQLKLKRYFEKIKAVTCEKVKAITCQK